MSAATLITHPLGCISRHRRLRGPRGQRAAYSRPTVAVVMRLSGVHACFLPEIATFRAYARVCRVKILFRVRALRSPESEWGKWGSARAGSERTLARMRIELPRSPAGCGPGKKREQDPREVWESAYVRGNMCPCFLFAWLGGLGSHERAPRRGMGRRWRQLAWLTSGCGGASFRRLGLGQGHCGAQSRVARSDRVSGPPLRVAGDPAQ